MRILYLCHRFPFPPERGGKIRPFNMIRHLSEQGHELTVASLWRSDHERRQGEGLAAHCAQVIAEPVHPVAAVARMWMRLPGPTPSSMGYFYSPRLRARIREAIREQTFDLILVHCSSVAPYVADVKGIPKLLDFGDMDSQKWLVYSRFRRFPLSAGYWLEGRKVRRAEESLAARFDMCTCTTRAEHETLESYATGTTTGWFPNGVDAGFFAPSDRSYDPDTVCFVGRMDYYPNQQAMVEFCDRTWPIIRRHRSGASLLIVGADPSAAVQRLGALDGVTVTGSVPDVRPYVTRAACTVAPLNIARGTQNKILESLAMGVPVVSSAVAAGGVDAIPGEHLLTADTPEGYAGAVLGLMDDAQMRERYARAGRERVLTHHDWHSSMLRLDALIDQCTGAFSNAESVSVSRVG